jgi:hypothetical protein
MNSRLFDNDAFHAGVTVAAQRIAAYAERENIPMSEVQCADLAETMAHFYEAFFAGVRAGAGSRTVAAARGGGLGKAARVEHVDHGGPDNL